MNHLTNFKGVKIINYSKQVQDSVQNKSINLQTNSLGNTLQIDRKQIEIAEIRTLQVDSARIVKPKKYIPIVKTPAVIPVSDTIEHPSYNVLDNNYQFPNELSLFESFNIEPFNPIEETAQKTTKTEDTKETKEIIIEIPDKSNLKSTTQKSNKVGFESTDWMLGVIIFLWIIFGWLRVGFGRFFQTAVQASYNFFAARRIHEEANVLRSRVFYFMNTLFFLNLALFLTQWLDFNGYNFYDIDYYLLFILILIILLIIYGFRGLVLSILDFIFLAKGSFSAYNTTVFIYNKLIGFVLLPVVSMLPYVPSHVAPVIFKISFGLIVIIYFLRIFRGLQVGFKIRLSIFYLILYLCALEILPVLMLFKIANSFI